MFPNYFLCICTYRRTHLLRLLLEDLSYQKTPSMAVIVDGDPQSNQVIKMLVEWQRKENIPFIYIPSNHSNLAYQRYLGWRIARQQGAPFLLYLDDDLRIQQRDAVEKTLAPIEYDPDVVAVTAKIVMGEGTTSNKDPGASTFLHNLYASRRFPAGSLTPAGDRILPQEDGRDYYPVEWLRGGVMAFCMDALSQDCFSEALFALTHIQCGKGEDTYLARRVLRRGKILYAACAEYVHPGEDAPKAYPTDAFRKARAVAYSRRLLNNIYRGDALPRFSDRLYLLRHYLSNMLLAWGRVVKKEHASHLQYALGYTLGAFQGIFRNPTARNLTPEIDWWADAEHALSLVEKIG